jgi:hypothetical protein
VRNGDVLYATTRRSPTSPRCSAWCVAVWGRPIRPQARVFASTARGGPALAPDPGRTLLHRNTGTGRAEAASPLPDLNRPSRD